MRFNSQVPAGLERVVRKCLEKDREQRYQTTRELLIALGNVRRECEAGRIAGAGDEEEAASGATAEVSHPVRRYRILRSWWALTLAAVMLVVAGLGSWWYGERLPNHPALKARLAWE